MCYSQTECNVNVSLPYNQGRVVNGTEETIPVTHLHVHCRAREKHHKASKQTTLDSMQPSCSKGSDYCTITSSDALKTWLTIIALHCGYSLRHSREAEMLGGFPDPNSTGSMYTCSK